MTAEKLRLVRESPTAAHGSAVPARSFVLLHGGGVAFLPMVVEALSKALWTTL